MTTNRDDFIIQSLEEIAELSAGEYKEWRMQSLAEQMTIREVMEWVFCLEEKNIEGLEFIPILEALYVTAGVDIHTSIKNLPAPLQAKMQELEPDLKQFGKLARRIVTALKEAKKSA